MSYPPLPAESGPEPTSAELAARNDPQLGTAYAVTVRSEGGSRESLAWTVLNFRLRRLDPSGRELPPTSVELRGRVLNGMIAEGDLIRLPNPLPNGGSLQLSSVQNLTTNSAVTVRATTASRGAQIAVLIVLVVLLLVVFGVIAVAMGTLASS